MTTNPSPDAEYEAMIARAVHTLDRDVILVANAGAGKTHLLVEHYFALLESGLEPSNLIAFTFTEKAANELKERIAKRLVSHPGFAELPEEHLHGWRNKIIAAPIGTIHQFCLKVIEASRRVEDKVAFKIVDEALDRPLQESLLRQFLRRRFEQEDPDAMRLLEAYGIRDLTDILDRYLSFLPLEGTVSIELPEAEPQEQDFLDSVARLAAPLWEEIQAQKRARAWMSFADLERRALDLLRSPNPSLAAFLKYVAHVLVDEFQDTAPIQIRLIEALRAQAAAAGRRMRLFCVGDPKQSIYRFRDVDRNLLQSTELQLLQGGGRKFDLAANHRSTPTVLGLVNAYARNAFPEAGASVAYRQDSSDTRAWICELQSEEEAADAESRAQEEARTVAAAIEGLRGEIPLDRIAVLYRASASALPLLRELQARGIPYSIRGGQNLFERQEILDLQRLLYFLSDPSDDLSLVGVLRSPLFLLSDASLFFLFREKAEGSLWEHLGGPSARAALQENFPQEYEKFLWALECLQGLLRRAKTLSAHALIEGLIRRQDLGDLYSLAYLDPPRKLAIEQWLDWLKTAAIDAAPLSLQAAVRLLKEVTAMLPNKTPLGDLIASRGCVQLLTIHAAKGLQFDSVFLIGMNRRAAREYPLLQRLGDALALKLPDSAGEKRRSARYAAIEAHHANEEEAEAKRLLYVAMTRAENRLAIVLPARRGEKTSLQEILLKSLGTELEAWKNAPGFPIQGPRQLKQETAAEFAVQNPPHRSPNTSLETTVSELETFLVCPLKHHWAYTRQVSSDSGEFSGDPSATEIGTLLHEALNLLHADPRKSAEDAVRQVLRFQPGLYDAAFPKRIQSDLQNYLHSPAYRLLLRAEEDYSELPFLLQISGAALRGQIDRLVRTKAGWLLIDFKHSGRKHSARELLGLYGFQLKTYVLAAEQILQAPLPAVQIHLLNQGEVYEFDFDAQELASHRKLLTELIQRLAEADTDLAATAWREACTRCPFHLELPLCPVPKGLPYRESAGG